MPRVHLVKKSRKEFPGIPKGSTYYWWKFPYSGIRRTLVRPRPSQLTQSEHKGEAYGIQEDLADLTVGDVQAEVDMSEYADRARELGETAMDNLYNMPESLQQGDTGQLLEQRASDMEDWASELEGVDTEVDSELSEEDAEDRAQEILDEIQNASDMANIE